jgi:acyl-coenzyme A thioesterase PaaI-like protein
MADKLSRIQSHHANCLGCGPENPGNLGLSFTLDHDARRVRSDVVLDRRHEGAPGFAHGGAVATALDDTLGTLLVVLEQPAVTAKLEVNYRRPAFLGRPYAVEAWCERIERRKLHLAAELRDEGEVVADAKALFLAVSLEHFLQGSDRLPTGWREYWGPPPGEEPQLPY